MRNLIGRHIIVHLANGQLHGILRHVGWFDVELEDADGDYVVVKRRLIQGYTWGDAYEKGVKARAEMRQRLAEGVAAARAAAPALTPEEIDRFLNGGGSANAN